MALTVISDEDTHILYKVLYAPCIIKQVKFMIFLLHGTMVFRKLDGIRGGSRGDLWGLETPLQLVSYS